MKLICSKCQRVYSESDTLPWRCACGGYLNYDYMPIFDKSDIRKNLFNMWRYDFAYPLKYEDLLVTYNEGLTPLVDSRFSGCNLKIKMDSLMPTGSFKDRGTVMVVNYLLKRGVSRITEDSSGNAGASVAGYCALKQVPCDIFVPKGNSKEKLFQIRAYGAKIHEIEGSREDVAAAAQKDSDAYAGHNWHPMFIQGTKSLAYELWEQLHFNTPDNIITVAGNGSCILGIYQGFKELLFNKMTDKMPRLFAVQAKNCNPIYRTFYNMELSARFSATIAEGIALADPNKCQQVVNAARNTHGQILCAEEWEIADAVRELSLNGFFVEPTSATAYAGLKQLLTEKALNPDSQTVMIVSGNGLKASTEISDLFDTGGNLWS